MSDTAEVYTKFLGTVLTSISGAEKDSEEVVLHSTNQDWIIYHPRDCCEQVWLEDVVGDLSDLIGNPILVAEKVCSEGEYNEGDDHVTWSYLKLGTIKGVVTFRWYGSSNGWYSEDVELCPKNKA